MNTLQTLITYALTIATAFTVIVFIHELGHFLVARWCGVKVDIFSIGFGKPFAGFTDRKGTRWQFSALPLGGYVKFEGDLNPASFPDNSKPWSDTSFNAQPLLNKAAIVVAGPLANFLLAIFLFAGLLMVHGEVQVPPRADGIIAGSAAEKAGIKPGDLIRNIDGVPVNTFQDLQKKIAYGDGARVKVTFERNGSLAETLLIPKIVEQSDGFGGVVRIGQLGISHDATKDVLTYKYYGPVEAVAKGYQNTWFIVSTTLKYVSRLFTGQESAKQLGGPGMIGAGAASAAKAGLPTYLWYIAFISISIGLINLFPVPMLDGGHLMFYALEALRGKPLGPQAMEWASRIGISFVLLLLAVGTFNDAVRLLVSLSAGS